MTQSSTTAVMCARLRACSLVVERMDFGSELRFGHWLIVASDSGAREGTQEERWQYRRTGNLAGHLCWFGRNDGRPLAMTLRRWWARQVVQEVSTGARALGLMSEATEAGERQRAGRITAQPGSVEDELGQCRGRCHSMDAPAARCEEAAIVDCCTRRQSGSWRGGRRVVQ